VDRSEAIRIIQGPFGQQLLRIAGEYVAPFFWGVYRPGVAPAISNGTAFFLQCGASPFVVTAAHVYRTYCSEKEREPTVVCQVGNMPFRLEERVIAVDKRLDVATFRIKEQEVKSIGRWIYRHDPAKWPPLPPEQGKGVFFAGYPGGYRGYRSDREIDFGIYAGILTATVVKEDTLRACRVSTTILIIAYECTPLRCTGQLVKRTSDLSNARTPEILRGIGCLPDAGSYSPAHGLRNTLGDVGASRRDCSCRLIAVWALLPSLYCMCGRDHYISSSRPLQIRLRPTRTVHAQGLKNSTAGRALRRNTRLKLSTSGRQERALTATNCPCFVRELEPTPA